MIRCTFSLGTRWHRLTLPCPSALNMSKHPGNNSLIVESGKVERIWKVERWCWTGKDLKNSPVTSSVVFCLLLCFFLISYITQTECQRNLQLLMRSVTHSCLTLCNPMDCSLSDRLASPWDCPGKHTRVGWHFFLQGIFLAQESDLHFLPLSHWRRPLNL